MAGENLNDQILKKGIFEKLLPGDKVYCTWGYKIVATADDPTCLVEQM